jgi:UDP-N-acetylmuramate dehydrogenase
MPATIGGALAMNAGTAEGAIGDFVSAVYFLHADGTIGELKPGNAGYALRALSLPPGAILLGARVALHRKPQREIAAELRARLKQRKTTQPMALAAAGWVWRHPGAEQTARLLEKVGLRGKRIGGAEISAKHANFIVNRGGATAADVLALMQLASDRVQAQLGLRLEPELRILGE